MDDDVLALLHAGAAVLVLHVRPQLLGDGHPQRRCRLLGHVLRRPADPLQHVLVPDGNSTSIAVPNAIHLKTTPRQTRGVGNRHGRLCAASKWLCKWRATGFLHVVPSVGEVVGRRLEHLVEEQARADAVDVGVNVANLVARRRHEEEEGVPEPGQPRRHDQIIVPILPVAMTWRERFSQKLYLLYSSSNY